MWDRFVNGLIDKQLKDHNSVSGNGLHYYRILDAGCGLGINGITTRLRNPDKALHIEGCDIHEPYIEIAKKHNIYDKVQCVDVSRMLLMPGLLYKKQEFDLALGIGVLTHLEKSDGKLFKHQLESVAKHVILTGTQTHIHNHKSLQNDPDIPELAHKSTWNYKDFEGYNIRGFHPRGSTGGSIIDTWLYPPLYTLTSIHPIFTKLTQYLVAWK